MVFHQPSIFRNDYVAKTSFSPQIISMTNYFADIFIFPTVHFGQKWPYYLSVRFWRMPLGEIACSQNAWDPKNHCTYICRLVFDILRLWTRGHYVPQWPFTDGWESEIYARADRYATCHSRLYTSEPDYSGEWLDQVGMMPTGDV